MCVFGAKWPALASAAVVGLLLGSCAKENPSPTLPQSALPTVIAPELRAMCSAETRSFGAQLQKSDVLDAAIEQRYGKVCRGLVRQDGLDFGGGQIAYSCRVLAPWIEDSSNTQRMDALDQAFGKRWLATDMARANTMNPKSILVPAEAAGSGGIEVNVVIVASETGADQRAFFFQEDVDGTLSGVKTAKGAFELLEWHNLLGYEAPIQGAVKPQCTAQSLSEEGIGWKLSGVAVLSNCGPVRYRDFLVSRSGKIDIVTESLSKARPPFCFMF